MEELEHYKECVKCNLLKEIEEFPKSGKKNNRKNNTRNCCKICWNKYNREKYLSNKEKYQNTRKKYQIENKEKIKEKRKLWKENKMKNDLLFRMKVNLRSLISISLRKKNITKKSKVENIIGCDFEFFKQYIEAQFTQEMTWFNIHLDHIKPLASSTTEQEILNLNHYTNFQPLLAKDNLSKNDSFIEKQLRFI